MKHRSKTLENLFERVLWSARLVVLAPVVACLAMALGALYLALVDVSRFLGLLVGYAFLDPADRSAVRSEAVTTLVKALDVFLIEAVLIVVAFGLYELFVGKIELAERSEVASRLLKIESLEELKERVAKLLIVILTVEFFQRALVTTYRSALDILYLAGAILLVSGALYLIGQSQKKPAKTGTGLSPEETGPDREE